MGDQEPGGTRDRLLRAAADLIAASPGESVPLRAICDAVGVRLPTLYHFFGNKEGLLDAVIEYGFEQYLDAKQKHESSGDPIQDIRDGWDAHVAFGIANPGFYALMYGQVTPGRRPAAQSGPTTILLALTHEAARRGRLAVDPDRAAAHILAANIGLTLRQIVTAQPDPELSVEMREATIAAVTGGHPGPRRTDASHAATTLLDLPDDNSVLGIPETVLLKKWLTDIARCTSPTDSDVTT
ncbi:TetR/AcrR family transcriptional regulator [Pseudonocardia endophytica]|uniref:TetR family transcriptional regulator n=1 Tax=Pseudonocardia endophytica TaxID=401976 RepID=A0A4R1HYI2_PSEEN|nr:TetR/AcrR family transcriptional regulator [Pseudonocardia endophytica]TCK27857.1 TetR family transcriptional regulator [Pseudonocardia endophytica]